MNTVGEQTLYLVARCVHEARHWPSNHATNHIAIGQVILSLKSSCHLRDDLNPFRTWSCAVHHCACLWRNCCACGCTCVARSKVSIRLSLSVWNRIWSLVIHFIMRAEPLELHELQYVVKEYAGCIFHEVGPQLAFEALHSWRIMRFQHSLSRSLLYTAASPYIIHLL